MVAWSQPFERPNKTAWIGDTISKSHTTETPTTNNNGIHTYIGGIYTLEVRYADAREREGGKASADTNIHSHTHTL